MAFCLSVGKSKLLGAAILSSVGSPTVVVTLAGLALMLLTLKLFPMASSMDLGLLRISDPGNNSENTFWGMQNSGSPSPFPLNRDFRLQSGSVTPSIRRSIIEACQL